MLTLLKNVPYEMSDFWSHLHRGYNSNEIIHYMYFATPPALHVKSSSDFLSRSILLLRGWQNIYGDVFADDSLTKVICPRRRHCTVRHTDWVEPDASDIAVFYDHNLTSTAPHRIPGQLWVYHAGKSQITLEFDHIENWDEYFNYIHDFRVDDTLNKFTKEFWKLDQPHTKFYCGKIKTHECKCPARVRCVVCIKLSSSFIEIQGYYMSAYTRVDECKRHKLLKQMLKENVDGMEPSNEQYNELDNPLLSQPSYTAYTQKAKMVLMI